MDVSAILTTSMNDTGVIGAVVVPGASLTSVNAFVEIGAEQAAWMHATSGGNPGVGTPDSGPGLLHARGTAFLSQLTTLSRSEVRAFVNAHPDTIAGLLAAPPAPSDVAAWWNATDSSTRSDLTVAAPQLVGNLEGVPYQVRSVANERYLKATIASTQSQLSTAGRAAADDLRAQLHMLTQIQAALKPSASGDTSVHITDPQTVRRLIGLDVAGTGRAIISIGDLSTADYVSVLVPGMFYSVDSELDSWADASADLGADQRAWLARLRPGKHDTVATVAWIGYQTPSLVDVASMDLARGGEAALISTLHGLSASRAQGAGQPYVSVLTHSYGATVALLALQDSDVTVDALAMVGSPGSPAKSVADLNVRDGNVWVAQASLDPVADTGVFGSQPLSASYGAHHFGVTGGVDPVTGAGLAGSLGHVDYFTSGSESFRNMALIGIGEGSLVLK